MFIPTRQQQPVGVGRKIAIGTESAIGIGSNNNRWGLGGNIGIGIGIGFGIDYLPLHMPHARCQV